MGSLCFSLFVVVCLVVFCQSQTQASKWSIYQRNHGQNEEQVDPHGAAQESDNDYFKKADELIGRAIEELIEERRYDDAKEVLQKWKKAESMGATEEEPSFENKVAVETRVEQKHCGIIADVAFIIDSSRSIWIVDFNRTLTFVKKLVESFDIGPDKTHIAALTYGDTVQHELFFSDKQEASAISEKIGGITHLQGGQTLTFDAIASMRTVLFSPSKGARADVPHLCILLTDGQSANRAKTIEEAKKAKADGITMIGIGIGQIDEVELRGVVSPPVDDNLFLNITFSNLNSDKFQSRVGLQACKVIETTTTTTTTTTTVTTKAPAPGPDEMQNIEPEKECQGKEADVVFVIDTSSSIWPTHFNEQMDFVSKVVDNFDINSGKTQVAIVTFSDQAEVQFYLNQYKDKESMKAAIESIEQIGGNTNTHLALQTMLDQILNRKHGSRPGIAHICILITDGESSKPELTKDMAKQVHERGVYAFTIGVGNLTNKEELELLASKPAGDYAFKVDGYQVLPTIQKILAYKTCELPSDQPSGCIDEVQADIMFGLHGIGGGHRAQMAELIKSVGDAFNLDAGNVRIGLIESCKTPIEIGQYEEKETFDEGVDEFMSTSIQPFWYQLGMSFGPLPSSGAKRSRIVVLLVSGDMEDMSMIYSDGMWDRFNTWLIVVNVNEMSTQQQLDMIDSYMEKVKPEKAHVFQVNNASELINIIRKIHLRTCKKQ